MQLQIQRGHEVSTDRKGRPKDVIYWFTYQLELTSQEKGQIEKYLSPYHSLYSSESLGVSVADILDGKHSWQDRSSEVVRESNFDLVVIKEQAVRKAATRLVSELESRVGYVGGSVIRLTGEDD